MIMPIVKLQREFGSIISSKQVPNGAEATNSKWQIQLNESFVVAMHCAGSEYRDRCGDQEPDMQVMFNI